MQRITAAIRRLWPVALASLLLAPGLAGRADDTVLFSTNVAPNVLLIADNSGSMENIVWHPSFDPNDSASWGCNAFSAAGDGTWGFEDVSSSTNRTYCGVTRTLYDDNLSNSTRWDHRYINWYFGLPAGDPILTQISATANGTLSSCLGGGTYSLYRRTRARALQLILREVICQVNQSGSVRFGLAKFRDDTDPEGGFVVVPIADYSVAQDALLQTGITNVLPETWTPLGETLFQIYTYFMSRTVANIPDGVDGTTNFPLYNYSTSELSEGGLVTGVAPPDPIQYHCQKSFVILITDGEPTMDDFDNDSSPGNLDEGFNQFANLIGDYNDDGNDGVADVEIQDDVVCTDCETALYLDDIAKYMQDTDFRPDLTGDQVIDVYTVGFTTTDFANDLLQKTAQVGNGQFYYSTSPEALAAAIVAAVTDIIQKSQAFTAATVPATRTADGGNFYTSFFIPSSKNPFWEGHVKNFTVNSLGQILDSAGSCALDDPDPPNCLEGQFLGTADPWWDAADEMPLPGSRTLHTTLAGVKTEFLPANISAANLGVTYPAVPPYAGSDETTAEGLADEIVQYIRGCEFGSGVGAGDNCVERTRVDGNPFTLGDIFHSDPVVVGPPNTLIGEASYLAFATDTDLVHRKRMLIAGGNDGFLHGFNAGDWVSATSSYDRGTGEEVFGFMPWYVRTRIKNLPIDSGNRDFYFVDGSPTVADVWFYPTATTAPQTDLGQKAADGSEWKTVLVGGLRQGGPQYYALDVTDPSITSGSSAYPIHLWDFPAEGGTKGFDSLTAPTYNYSAYMGETWSDPVIAKVKVNVPGDGTGGVYERWVAIFGAGYDPTGDPNHVSYDATNAAGTSRKGRGIFMVDLKTGKVLAAHFYHHDNTSASLGTAAGGNSEMRYAFASAPAVIDSDFDGFADLVYIGDLGGNLWKWVLLAPGDDTVNPTENVNKHQTDWPFGKIFIADLDGVVGGAYDGTPGTTIGAATYYKSFYFPPAAVYFGSQLWLAVGTGERANPTFPGVAGDTTENNRFYAFKDPNKYGLPNTDLNGDTTADTVITESLLSDLTDTEGCASLSTVGYYIVAREAEKFVTNVEIIGYYVLTGSFTPNNSTDPCDSGGSATLYIFRVYCGEGFYPENSGAAERRLELQDGMPTSPRLSLGEENRLYMMTSENVLKSPTPPPLPKPTDGIFYWRERSD